MKEHNNINVTTSPPTVTPVCDSEPGLSVRQWLFTGVLMMGLFASIPRLWQTLEAFAPGPDYRLPYALSDDYWLYQRYCKWSVDQHDVMVIGDSVVWGHYVPSDGSLSHYLNQMPGARTFANLGIDGIHPAAMAGLLKHYGQAITGKTVILSFNPLWMTSKKHDLQTDKEFRFNHPRLVPQFRPKIACYTESIPNRIDIVMERHIQILSWASHLRTAYFSKMDLSSWAMAHPYDCPVRGVPFELPGPQDTPEQEDPWNARSTTQQDFPWVSLDTSVQWTFFKQAIKILQDRGNTVFVLMGPFNEHMMTDKSLEIYGVIKAGVKTWLQENNVPYAVPAPLPSALYADASHPLRAGYATLAQSLFDDESFQAVVLSPAEPAQ